MDSSSAGQHNDDMEESHLPSGDALRDAPRDIEPPDITPVDRTPLPAPVRWALLALAFLSLGLAIVGVILPVLPTVPFVLLAAWAAARSSPKLDAWLLRHPHLGPILADWRQGGKVPRRAKWMAAALMGFSGASMLLVLPGHWLPYAAIACMAIVLVWLWRRPEPPPR